MVTVVVTACVTIYVSSVVLRLYYEQSFVKFSKFGWCQVGQAHWCRKMILAMTQENIFDADHIKG